MNIVSSYLESLLDPKKLNKLAKALETVIKASKWEFDSIAIRGMSGGLIVPMLAVKLDKPIIMVRKNDGNHGYHAIEGNHDSKNFIIVDDVIASGATVKTILETIAKHMPNAKCTGIFLYRDIDRKYFRHNDVDIPVKGAYLV